MRSWIRDSTKLPLLTIHYTRSYKAWHINVLELLKWWRHWDISYLHVKRLVIEHTTVSIQPTNRWFVAETIHQSWQHVIWQSVWNISVSICLQNALFLKHLAYLYLQKIRLLQTRLVTQCHALGEGSWISAFANRSARNHKSSQWNMSCEHRPSRTASCLCTQTENSSNLFARWQCAGDVMLGSYPSWIPWPCSPQASSLHLRLNNTKEGSCAESAEGNKLLIAERSLICIHYNILHASMMDEPRKHAGKSKATLSRYKNSMSLVYKVCFWMLNSEHKT